MTREIRFGIAGAGMVAQYHATAITNTPGARLIAICRSDTGRAAEIAARFGVSFESSLEALVARDDIDAVCICTPSGLHAAQTITAARAGKHVLVEKPIALTLADTDAMIAACVKAGVLLGVSLQRRTDPLNVAVHSALEQGALGPVVMASVTIPYWRPQSYYDSAAWRGTYALDGGGILMNQGIHLVDLLLWFMGDVARVHAWQATLGHVIEVEDTITAALVFRNGALGSILGSACAVPGFPHKIEIYGMAGSIQTEGDRIVRWESAAPPPPGMTAAPGTAAAEAGASPTGISAEGHSRIVQDFVRAIHGGGNVLISGEQGRRSLELVLAAYQSAQSGQTVVLAD